MKFLILISTFIFALTSGAQSLDPAVLKKLNVLACKSTSQEIPTGIITLTEGKHMTEFKVDHPRPNGRHRSPTAVRRRC